jgi:hypothetical protein
MSQQRRERRAEERAKMNSYPAALQEAKAAGEAAEKFLKSMIKRFEDQYNGFLTSADNGSPATGVAFQFNVSEIYTPESELRKSLNQIPEELFNAALRKDDDQNQIKIMYLRCDKTTFLKEGHNIQKRPGVPEEVSGDVHTSLLYHAAVILTNENQEELEAAAAHRKLVDDFISHLFMSGIQYQEMANEKQWQYELRAQNAEIQKKTQEVADIFNHAAEMKVAH